MASEGNLGLISIDNIRVCLQRIIDLHLFEFDINEFLDVAGCYYLDNTLDILFESELQAKRMITAISAFSSLESKKYYSLIYKRNGLLIRRRVKNIGYSLVIYCKGEELRHSFTHQNRATHYTNMIGRVGEDIARRTLRIELHINKMKAIRDLLGIPNSKSFFVSLLDVLNSTATPILDILYDLGIDEEILIKFLTWYEPIAGKDEKEEPLTDDEFKELLTAERIAELVKENNFNTSTTMAHIITEYNISPENKLFNKLIPYIKANLYQFLCFRKPKTITAVLNLLNMIYATYGRNAGGNNE
mgnify:CR=1 FL=1